jgi:hypothetical protein
MSICPTPDDVAIADHDDPAIAFERMSLKLAGLTAAIEGFAARQQELHVRTMGRTSCNSMGNTFFARSIPTKGSHHQTVGSNT